MNNDLQPDLVSFASFSVQCVP